MPRPVPPLARRAATGVLLGALVLTGLTALPAADASPASASTTHKARAAKAKKVNVVTPGDFTGYGFDQCQAPSQAKMNVWMRTSPFQAVGIYIDGDSRACRKQTYLNATWVSNQLANGWRLLPITLGPQASCQPRFPRYRDDFKISPAMNANGGYSTARQQGITQATKSVAAATALGIVAGSTLWYDLEGFDYDNTKCRESALWFLSGWTQQIKALGYVSGVYSSAGSGIKALDEARVNRPTAFALPDRIWIARWDGIASTSTPYIRNAGWRPHARIKQYQGGHNETWGGVTINIDRNYLDLGQGSVAGREVYCGGVSVPSYGFTALRPPTAGTVPSVAQVKALQCLLQEQGLYRGRIHGRLGTRVLAAANAWQSKHGLPVRAVWGRRAWVSLLSAGDRPIVKFGSTGPAVRRLQRALSAAGNDATAKAVRATGVFDAKTDKATRAWQARVGLPVTGVAAGNSWRTLQAGTIRR
jgi:peptidoglycan hydrolase-like protein with peptidoglycan-binding domain